MMKLTQCKIKWLARLVLGLALFAQGAFAATICIAPAANQGQGQVHAIGLEDKAAPCHESTATQTNACLAHGGQADQINVDQHNATIAAPVSVITWLAPLPQTQHERPAIATEYVALNTGPPIPIRFCSFLN